MSSDLVVPGANTLRGGKKEYTAKTLNSNWVEDRREPRFGGVRRHAATEAVTRALEATGGRVPSFGTGLKDEERKAYDEGRIDYDNVVNYDLTAKPLEWESVTKSTFKPPTEATPTEFRTTFMSKPHALNADPSTTEEYRKRWIVGDKGAPSRRFTTETTISQGAPVASKYRHRLVRDMPGIPKAVEVFRRKIAERGGSNGIHAIGRMFRIMDDSGDRKLSKSEVKYGMQDFGLRFSVDEYEALWRFIDRDGSNFADYDELLLAIRGRMNERRVAMVRLAFDILDKTDDDRVTVADLQGTYDTSFHPDVISGKITPKQALEQFLTQWDTVEKDGVVSFDEFCVYYDGVSSSIDDDDYFELMIRNAWHIAGGEGASANTSNLRVLVTFTDGRKSVECVNEDLGLKKTDSAGIIARLTKQGLSDIASVSTDF